MEPVELRGDCTRCEALCCVALAFDRSEWFSFSKSAYEPCKHLDVTNRCRVHAMREQHGLAGCVNYDCYGAGQRTCRLFAGEYWRSDAALRRELFQVFFVFRQIHELLCLLAAAEQLELPVERERQRMELRRELERASAADREALLVTSVEPYRERTHAFLRSLRPWASPEGRKRSLPTV